MPAAAPDSSADRPSISLDRPLAGTAREELKWLGLTLVLSFAGGWLAGIPLLLPLCAAVGYAVWLIHRLGAVVLWLQDGARSGTAPPSTGLTDAVIARVYREKKYSAKQKARYRSALAQFTSLASELPDATVVVNEQRQIRWANRAALKLLSVHPERDRGQRIDNLIRDPVFQSFLSEPPAGTDMEMATPHSPDRTLALRKTPTGRNMCMLIARDVTQRVRVREMRKGFVADVSHELRTPLTVINGYLEMLREDKSLPDDVQMALQQVGEQSDRMRHLVEHLLELSKLEGNPLEEHEGERFAVSAAITAIYESIRREFPEHEFIIDADPELTVTGSPAELYSLCQNLMANAVRYTHKGTRVTVSWKADDQGRGVFAVKDNGPGIEAHHLPRLSERFYRVDRGRSRDQGGTGLGLAIVKHVSQRHGGDLEIDSTPGAGSQFWVRFPAIRCQRGGFDAPHASAVG